MNSAMPTTPSVVTNAPTAVTTSGLTRLRQSGAQLVERAQTRFTTATAAFSDAWRWTTMPRTAMAKPPTRELRLAGFLFPQEGGAPVSLYEGTFLFASASLQMLRPESQGGDRVSVERDFLQLSSDGAAALRVHTNEKVRIGTRRYVVKLLEESCRMQRTVEIDAEGRLR